MKKIAFPRLVQWMFNSNRISDFYDVHNLLSGTEDFRSARNDVPLPQTAAVEEDRKAIKELAQAYYETARYMMLNNFKKNAVK